MLCVILHCFLCVADHDQKYILVPGSHICSSNNIYIVNLVRLLFRRKILTILHAADGTVSMALIRLTSNYDVMFDPLLL